MRARGLLLRAAAALRARALAVPMLLGAVLPAEGRAQGVTSMAPSELSAIGARVDALTILGGDFGFSDGNFHSLIPDGGGPRSSLKLGVTKIGGDGEIGDPVQLGDTSVGWQPRVLGSAGYLESTENIATPRTAGDISKMYASSVEFGGGVRFWMDDHLSFAPSVMLLYGHTSESYTANSTYSQTNLSTLKQLGLIDWNIDTLSLRPALNAQYVQPIKRSLLTLSIDGAAFLTHTLSGANERIEVAGQSGFLTYKADVDIPLGVAIDGHEVRSGGYISRTQLFGQLADGLAVSHLNEVHGRFVLDFLNEAWKVQWIGIGASYVWGPSFAGWTVGADISFKF